jgi:hypothetical protein
MTELVPSAALKPYYAREVTFVFNILFRPLRRIRQNVRNSFLRNRSITIFTHAHKVAFFGQPPRALLFNTLNNCSCRTDADWPRVNPRWK